MMIAVQTIRAHTARAPAETALSVTSALALSMRRRQARNDAYGSSNKRKLDCWEAFDYQTQKKQKMRCSLLWETSAESSVYPQQSLEQQAPNDKHFQPPVGNTSMKRYRTSQGRTLLATNSNDDLRKQARKHLQEMHKKGTTAGSRGAVKMTKKLCNKKKRLEMMEATSKHIQGILGLNRSATLSRETIRKGRYLRHQADRLESYLRSRCNSIVQKEKDIKLWLGLRTSNKKKIVKLTRKLHQRWGEVKEIQSQVKPYRLRLKSLKYAMLCEERTIMEEDEEMEC
jgi:hypothetical protein